MLLSSLFIALCSFWTLVSASPIDPVEIERRRLTYPRDDPFYTPKGDWASRPNGAVLDSRRVQAAALSIIPTLSLRTYQILYKTTDQDGNPFATVVTAFVPLLADKGKLLSYSVAEDSGASHCAVSYQYRLGSDASNVIAQAELALIQIALTQRWVVVTADYQGPNSAWLAGRLEGRAVLDSIRAATQFGDLGLDRDVKIGLWGYSGGGAAVGWAAALHPSYAPELNIVGVSQGGTPVNLTNSVLGLNDGPFAGFIPIGFGGLSQAYPAVKAEIDKVGTQRWRDLYDFTRSTCGVSVLLTQIGNDYLGNDTYFLGGAVKLLTNSVVKPVLDTLILGSVPEVPRAPMQIYHSREDQVLPYADAEQMVNNYCNAGVKVSFVTNSDNVVGHVLMEVFQIPRSIRFFRDRFDGKPFISSCERVNVGVSTVAGAVQESFQLGLPLLAPLIGLAIAAFQAIPTI